MGGRRREEGGGGRGQRNNLVRDFPSLGDDGLDSSGNVGRRFGMNIVAVDDRVGVVIIIVLGTDTDLKKVSPLPFFLPPSSSFSLLLSVEIPFQKKKKPLPFFLPLPFPPTSSLLCQ
jgi:hypothetical protein